jgi:hypothetical protein
LLFIQVYKITLDLNSFLLGLSPCPFVCKQNMIPLNQATSSYSSPSNFLKTSHERDSLMRCFTSSFFHQTNPPGTHESVSLAEQFDEKDGKNITRLSLSII